MRAWVIKMGRRFASDEEDGDKWGPLKEAKLFSSKERAKDLMLKGYDSGHENEKVVRVNIMEATV